MQIVPHLAADPQRQLLMQYECLGWFLTPARGKRPIAKDWPDTAACDAQKAAAWLDMGSNLALVTGKRSGIVVVDVDPRNGGERGLLDLEQKHGSLPETLTCETGGGGFHFYFRHYQGAKTSKPAEGVDYQVDRRCVIVPPSVHPDTGNGYQWASDPTSTVIAELPESWRTALSAQTCRPMHVSDDGPIPEGKRNSTLFNIARHLYGNGDGESSVIAALAEQNYLRCVPPLSVDEVRQIARSAYRYKPTEQSHLTRWQQCIWRSDLDRRDLYVGLALSSFADTNGRNCFPSQDEIAARARYTRQRVSHATTELQRAGWLRRIAIGRDGEHGWRYTYHLTIPGIDVLSEDNGGY